MRSNLRRTGEENVNPSLPSSILRGNKRPRRVTKYAHVRLQILDVPLISPLTGLPVDSLCLESDRLYTIGRANANFNSCDFLFDDLRVSKRHCQLIFDSLHRKIFIIDGVFLSDGTTDGDVISEVRSRVFCHDELEGEEKETAKCLSVKASMNGVFVNAVRVERGMARELSAGDEVCLACGNEGKCNLRVQIGFMILGFIFKEEVVTEPKDIQLERPRSFETTNSAVHSQRSVSGGKRNKRVFAIRRNEIMPTVNNISVPKRGGIVRRAKFLLSNCRHILHTNDPISYIRQNALSDFGIEIADACKFAVESGMELDSSVLVSRQEALVCQNSHLDQGIQYNKEKNDIEQLKNEIANFHSEDDIADNNPKEPSLNYVGMENAPCFGEVVKMETWENCPPPPGKNFYLNRLQFRDHESLIHENCISLPELLYPIESISQVFIATFTSDILWFLSYCEIPCHLPVTIACHNTERCWSSNPDKRTSVPYSDFPNLVVVFPPFPEAIAFGNDRKRQGIACHHPKLIVLQREDSIRVIITSANLVANQWNNVTNTVWWQDFPSRSAPNFSSLFIQVSDEVNQDSISDFAAQLAGFMASLVIDVPSQAHWVVELTKYNFEGAAGHLIASVPGIHSRKISFAFRHAIGSFDVKFLGSVESFVVGLSHLFHSAADRNGAQLKSLAGFLSKLHENEYGMSEVVLRRNTNVPADANAVSIFIPNPDDDSKGDCVQLGFLPRYVAKWVSPLWDSGFFRFSGYVYPKEVLAGALGGSRMRVQLLLHVSQGPHFPVMTRMMQPEHVVAFCSLVASIQRCTGLWRLQEVLGQFRWPEMEQSDFIYGSSSIGSSINAQFLAAFSAAAGKKSLEFLDSEESDPEWACWSASQELRNPSIRIIFPTIERVKNASNGILPSRRILCFSEKTWQRLRIANILYDAVPHPHDRVGQPMHVKVARRRFQSKEGASSFGWVYCGSHNFSAAAWGRSISLSLGLKSNEATKTNSSTGLRLHVCNYELGIIFTFPQTETNCRANSDCANLDDIVLPFVVPAPKYGPTDRPATGRAMRDALSELTKQESEKLAELSTMEDMAVEIPYEEEEVVEASDYVVEEKEEEKAYAEMLWIQVDSSQSC